MTVWRHLQAAMLSALSVIGCGNARPAAEGPTPASPPAAPPAVTSAPANPALATEPPAYDDLPPICSGADLDLDAVIASGRCEHGSPAAPPPSVEEIIVHLTASPVVDEGGAQDVTLNIRNRSGRLLVIDLKLDCGEGAAFAVRSFVGKTAPPAPACDEGCATRTVRIGLPDGGLAHKVVQVAAVERGACGGPRAERCRRVSTAFECGPERRTRIARRGAHSACAGLTAGSDRTTRRPTSDVRSLTATVRSPVARARPTVAGRTRTVTARPRPATRVRAIAASASTPVPHPLHERRPAALVGEGSCARVPRLGEADPP